MRRRATCSINPGARTLEDAHKISKIKFGTTVVWGRFVCLTYKTGRML